MWKTAASVSGSHVKRLLRQVIHLAVVQLPERSRRVSQRHVQAEVTGHMERLTEEALRIPGPFSRQFVGLRQIIHAGLRQIIHAQDGYNVLQLLAALKGKMSGQHCQRRGRPLPAPVGRLSPDNGLPARRTY
eukprot:997852_1